MARLGRLLFSFALFSACFQLIARGINRPYGGFDAWAIWNLKARFIYVGDWSTFLSYDITYSHPDYPLLLPVLVAGGWSVVGSETVVVPIIYTIAFTLGVTAILFFTLQCLGIRFYSWWSTATLLLVPSFVYQGGTQMSDIPLAFFVLATVACLTLYEREARIGWVVLAGLSASAALFTKNEGAMIALMIALVYGVRFRKLSFLLVFGGVILPFAAGLLYYKLAIVPPNGILEGLDSDTFAKLIDPLRYMTIIRYSFVVWAQNFFLTLVLLAGLPLSAGAHVKFRLTSPVVVTVLVLAGYFAIYVVTPLDLVWHIDNSFDRLALHVLPVFLLGVSMGIQVSDDSPVFD
jgi:4-amino-4-deoxy-L-arabinose transferase-like glycosyltransferase